MSKARPDEAPIWIDDDLLTLDELIEDIRRRIVAMDDVLGDVRGLPPVSRMWMVEKRGRQG